QEAYFEFLVKPLVHPLQTLSHLELIHQPEGKVSRALNRYQHETYQLRIGHHFESLTFEMKARVQKQLSPGLPKNWDEQKLIKKFLGDGSNAMQFMSFLRKSALTRLKSEIPSEYLIDKGEAPLAYLQRLLHKLLLDIQIDEEGTNQAQEAWTNQRASYTGFIHVMLALLRRQDIPARALSFYLSQSKDATAQSIEYGLEVAGENGLWLLMDPLRQQLGDENYLKVAHGRDCEEIPSVKSFFRGNSAQCNQLINEQADFCYEIFHKQPQQ
ncbi:MAG: transglutaminase domain-containing protein, partial [Bacteroidota bacterium]